MREVAVESIWGAIIIVGCLFLLVIVDWIRTEYKKFKARQKKKASKPIDRIPVTYDRNGRIRGG